MREFLLQYWLVILLGAFLLGWGIYLAINKRWTELREDAYRLMKIAEKTITGTKMGQERFNTVLTQIYDLIPLPSWIKVLVPETLVRKKLQKWYNEIKDKLDDGKINNSTGIPKPPSTILKKNM